MKSNFIVLLLFLPSSAFTEGKAIQLDTLFIESKIKYPSVQIIESQEFLKKNAFQILLDDFYHTEDDFISGLSQERK